MKDRILKILKDIRPESDFELSKDFQYDGLLDSFDMVVLVADLDKSFGISIDGEQIVPENFSSIDTIKNLLVKCGARP